MVACFLGKIVTRVNENRFLGHTETHRNLCEIQIVTTPGVIDKVRARFSAARRYRTSPGINTDDNLWVQSANLGDEWNGTFDDVRPAPLAAVCRQWTSRQA